MIQALRRELDSKPSNEIARLSPDQSNALSSDLRWEPGRSPEPDQGFRWRPPEKFGPPSRRILDLFSRYDFGWGARGRSEHYPALAEVLDRGLVGLRMRRLPSEAVNAAAAVRMAAGPRESLEHKRLKRAAVLWMKSEGAADAMAEVTCAVGRADAYSKTHAWAVECGNTDIRKMQDALLAPKPIRFTLIPYQEIAYRDGTPRHVIAVDLLWTLETAEAVREGVKARDARGRALRRLYAPDALSGRA